MKTCLYNANIYQGNKQFCNAMIIDDDHIVFCGSNEDALNKEYDKKYDLKSKTIIPGLNDSHMHLFSLAKKYSEVDISNASSIEDLINKVIKFKNDNPDLCKDGIYSRGFIEEYFDEKTLPNAFDLDRISKDIPIVLSRVCGHVCVCNHKALEMLDELYGLNNLPENEVIKDDKGNPSGVITEMAVFKADNLIPNISYEKLKKLVYKALIYCASVGLTSIQANDINDFNNEKYIFDILDELYEEYPNLIRYRHQCCFKDYDDFKNTIEDNKYHLSKNINKISLGPLKLYKDGSLGACTAQMYDGYLNNPNNKGIGVNSENDIYQYVSLANRNNIQVITHCIGDRAIDETVDAYIKANKDSNNLNRHGIVHCQITTKEMIEKMARNNISIFYQPIFLEYDLHIVYDRVCAPLANSSYAFKTANRLGAQVSFGSDCPIEDCNGFYNLHCAINRTDLNGSECYLKDECMDIYEAIDCFTIGSAKAEFKENELGLLKEGYLADFLILDEDIFNDSNINIKDIKPLYTIVGGKIAYKK